MKEFLKKFSPTIQLLFGCSAVFPGMLILTQIVLAIEQNGGDSQTS